MELIWIIILIVACFNQQNALPNSNKSGEYLLKTVWPSPSDYDQSVRPVAQEEDVVKIKFSVALGQIVDMDTKGESLTVSLFLRQAWDDPYLKWNPAQYDGLNKTNLSPGLIWLPDIVLENNIDKENELRGNLDQLPKKVIVSHDGHVQWLAIAVLTGKCPMDITYFPFDVQRCELRFLSWTFDASKLDISPINENVDLVPYTKHSEWQLLSAKQIRTEETYPCCKIPYSVVTVAVTLRRRPLFHVMHLIIPMLIIALLTIFIFNIPSKSGERVSYGVTLLLAMTLFMLLLAEKIPPNADALSKLGVFFNLLIIEMVVILVTICYVARMYHKNLGDKSISGWMRKYVYDHLAYVLRVRKNENREAREAKKDQAVKIENGVVKTVLKPWKRFANLKRNGTKNASITRNDEDGGTWKASGGDEKNDGNEMAVLGPIQTEKEPVSIQCTAGSEEQPEVIGNENVIEKPLGNNSVEKQTALKSEETEFQIENETNNSSLGNSSVDKQTGLKDEETEFQIENETKNNSLGTSNSLEKQTSLKDKEPSKIPAPLGKQTGFKSLGLQVIKENVDSTANAAEPSPAEQPKQATLNSSIKPKLTFRGLSNTVTKLMKNKNDLLLAKMNQEKGEKKFFYEWRICALTLDRLCFIIFLLVFIVTAIAVFHDF